MRCVSAHDPSHLGSRLCTFWSTAVSLVVRVLMIQFLDDCWSFMGGCLFHPPSPLPSHPLVLILDVGLSSVSLLVLLASVELTADCHLDLLPWQGVTLSFRSFVSVTHARPSPSSLPSSSLISQWSRCLLLVATSIHSHSSLFDFPVCIDCLIH